MIRSKRRPVILVAPPLRITGLDLRRRGQARLEQPLHLVVPVYTLFHRITGTPKFDLEVVDRIRSLEYPHLFYLPAYAHTLSSLVQLNRPHGAFLNELDPWEWGLSDEVLKIVQGGLVTYVTGLPDERFSEIRKLLLE